jgi:hypothetical protein
MARKLGGLAAVGLVVGAVSASAQTLAAPDTSVGGALRSLAARASDVFVGQVVGITRLGGVVEIVFRVDQSVAGTQGATCTLREWAGLWPPGEHRYWVGERAMLFLHAAGKAGLRSPVDGAEGVVPVMLSASAGEPQVDVRRLATRVLRSKTAPLPDADNAAIALSEATALVRGWRSVGWREPVLRPLPIELRPVAMPLGRGRIVTPEPPFVGTTHVEWEPGAGGAQIEVNEVQGANDVR